MDFSFLSHFFSRLTSDIHSALMAILNSEGSLSVTRDIGLHGHLRALDNHTCCRAFNSVILSLSGLMTSVAFRIRTANLPHTTRRLLPSVSFTFKRNQHYINLSVHLLYSLLTILMFLISSGFSVRFSIVNIGVLCIQAGKNKDTALKILKCSKTM